MIFVGDNSFAVHELVHAITRRATLITRLRVDSRLFAPPPQRTSRTIGRPAQKGAALPKLKTLLSAPATCWIRILVSARYGHNESKALDIKSGTVVQAGHMAASDPFKLSAKNPCKSAAVHTSL